MKSIKVIFFISSIFTLIFSCSQPDQAQCACLKQAEKVNELTQVIWQQNASHNDSLELSKALKKKTLLCKELQEASPDLLHELQETCQQ
ncbi:MAG: hypothetical protein RLZZ337_1196 [Bacteroidota bacterium]|jgi:hypothetical protein